MSLIPLFNRGTGRFKAVLTPPFEKHRFNTMEKKHAAQNDKIFPDPFFGTLLDRVWERPNKTDKQGCGTLLL